MKYFAAIVFSLLFITASAQELLKKEYHDNGTLSLTVYKVGHDIHYIAYHANGMLFEKGAYRNGKRNGTWERCNASGETLTYGNYVNDKPDGEWLYKLHGGQRANAVFDRGELTSGLHVDANGEVIAQR